ncbi:50S ribosomal protein L23 [Candidatus Roizmanbacteria bacterium]|nr:50S ribosomal protein L23 [Candidatus Roizmanbacteria bacterium]
MKINEILLKPIITEKATNLSQKKVYMFEVHIKANKDQIGEALEKLYQVEVNDVKIMIRKGKVRKLGRRMSIKKMKDRKIAFVSLRKGEINLFPQA